METIFVVGLPHYLVLSSILLVLGLYVMVTRRNGIRLLMGIELILNAANLNLIAFNRYITPSFDGQVFAVFVMILAASEAAVALAIVLAISQATSEIHIDELAGLKE